MADKKQKIEHPNIIFCEGLDAKLFLIWYLNSEALSDNPTFANSVQVIDFGGITQLATRLELLRVSPEYEMVKSLLIIRDAETNAQGAVSSVQSALRKTGFSVPDGPGVVKEGMPKIGFLLFPTCDNLPTTGALEDLCYSILSEDPESPVFPEITSFIQQMEEKGIRTYPRKFKTLIHTYFSVTDDYVSLKIGEAAKAGAFNWEHPKLKPLRNFMTELFN